MHMQYTHPTDPAPGNLPGAPTNPDDPVGLVYKKTGPSYTVHLHGCSLLCTLSPRLSYPAAASPRVSTQAFHCSPPQARQPKNQPADPNTVVVGDLVRVEQRQPEADVIVSVLPRRNKLARRSAVPMPSAHPFEQVIAANLDQVLAVVAAADPPLKWNLLDRYLVSAEAAGIPALICLTKLDLAPEDPQAEFWQHLDSYRRLGYPLVCVSALTGAGLEPLRQALSGRLSVLLGKSGVGKTSLLNALQPELGLRVNAVSRATGKGKHTTTHQELFPLDPTNSDPHSTSFTTALVDTPGLREFGLWDVNRDDLALFFPEMRPLVGRCRFGLSCGHDEEPGCAIRMAVLAGQISPLRYQSYLKLKEEL
jgi:ribosome biogenesis GTPase